MKGITYRRLGPDDVALLMAVPVGLFDQPPDADRARAFLDDPLHEIVLAYADGVAVGMATGTVILHPDKPPSLFINEVGTRDGHLRQGIGRTVTRCLIDIGGARGCRGAWLGTEPDNAAALGLYRAMGGQETAAVFFGWDDAQ